jgi:hypothetical protein
LRALTFSDFRFDHSLEVERVVTPDCPHHLAVKPAAEPVMRVG